MSSHADAPVLQRTHIRMELVAIRLVPNAAACIGRLALLPGAVCAGRAHASLAVSHRLPQSLPA